MERSNQFLKKHPKTTKWSTSLLFLVLFLLFSCKEDGASHLAAGIQSCYESFNDNNWDDAIEVCIDVGTDETLHIAAQAYMARSGVSLFNIMLDLSDSTIDPSKIMFDKIPNTVTKRSDYNAALSIIMNDIGSKTENMYLESIILSGLLIFDQLKTLLTLEIDATTDQFVTCADDPSPGDITQCAFAPSNSLGTLTFGGLGANFYTKIYNNTGSDLDTVTHLDGIPRNVTIQKCTIQPKSLLNYNKIAVNEYYKDGIGIQSFRDALVTFKFYENMDDGSNFHRDIGLGDTYFCKGPGSLDLIPVEPTSDNMKLNDCEILGYLESPGF